MADAVMTGEQESSQALERAERYKQKRKEQAALDQTQYFLLIYEKSGGIEE